MATKKISAMTAITPPLLSTAALNVVTGGASRKATVADVLSFMQDNLEIIVPALVTQATASRAFDPADASAYVRYTGTGAKTGTFDSTDGFATNEEYHITNRAASGDLTLSGTGITLNPPKGGSLVLAPGDTVTVKFVSATVADVFGSTEP